MISVVGHGGKALGWLCVLLLGCSQYVVAGIHCIQFGTLDGILVGTVGCILADTVGCIQADTVGCIQFDTVGCILVDTFGYIQVGTVGCIQVDTFCNYYTYCPEFLAET